MTSFRRKRLGEIIVSKGLITQEQISELLARPEGRGKRIGELLADNGLITEEVLAQALAEQRDLRYLDLAEFRINPAFFEKIPVELMQRYQFVPVEETDGGGIVVAMTDPNNIPAIDELEMILDRPVDVCVSTTSAILAVVKRSGTSERVLHTVSEDFKLNIVKEQENGEEVLSLESIDKDESPIIKLMHTTIFDAIQRRASDIHIESTDKNVSDQVPHRRRALPRHRADRHQVPQRHRVAHQGHERPRHRRAPRAPGRQVQDPDRRQDHRLPRLDPALAPSARTWSSASWTRNPSPPA